MRWGAADHDYARYIGHKPTGQNRRWNGIVNRYDSHTELSTIWKKRPGGHGTSPEAD